MKRYTANWDHLGDEIDRALYLLRNHCLRRVEDLKDASQVPGLQVSTEEVIRHLSASLNPFPVNDPLIPDQTTARVEALESAWLASETIIEAGRLEANSRGIRLTFSELGESFGLSRFEQDVIVLCFLPEIVPAVSRLFAFLQDDLALTRPTGRLLLTWLAPDLTAKQDERRYFDPDRPLLGARILTRPGGQPGLDQPLYLSERVIRFLMNVDSLDPWISDFCHVDTAPADIIQVAEHALYQYLSRPSARPQFCVLAGRRGCGRLALARAISTFQERPLLVVDGEALAGSGEQFRERLIRLLREAQLQNAVLYLQHSQVLLEEKQVTSALFDIGARGSDLIFLAREQTWFPTGELSHFDVINWQFELPSEPERLAQWRQVSAGTELDPAVNLRDLAGRFRFTGGQIEEAWHTAALSAQLRQPENPVVNNADLYTSAQRHSTHRLGQLSEAVRLIHSWDDIILPDKALAQLREIVDRARHAHRVYNEWGFGRKVSASQGLAALFTGPSGTGKTMAAGIIARELGMEMYRIDLSSVVSKYVGETEKNLGRIFDEAWRSNAVLFFDEADALFGKRSEVRDSHDRYANIEVNYLLQRLDNFEGLAILASNLSQNIDDAFQRRLQFTVNFPLPEEESRYQIWRQIWPAETPLKHDIAFGFLASNFKLNGGEIRNIALQAAFLAASDGQVVAMNHVLEAVVREMRKSGRLLNPADFGSFAGQMDLD